MKVFKFGGASVKDAAAVKNVAKIISSFKGEKLVVIVSAMGKTTNAFETLLESFYFKKDDLKERLEFIKSYHFNIVEELFEAKDHFIYNELHNTFVEAEWQLEDEPIGTFDFEYDQLVSLGELLSTKIVSAYLNKVGLQNEWLDARDLIRTDNTYRKAQIDWNITNEMILNRVNNSSSEMLVSQGFIGSTSENFTTTLGREGSDFSAAIFANALLADEVIIWKDVEGMLNADPKFYNKTIKLNSVSYKEAVELAYYGASVIHPKTIKPLQNKNIPLRVKSFINPDNRGSLINQNTDSDSLVPSYIHKENQILISISSKDYSFITERKLSEVFKLFADNNLSVNMMQNSAISFSICLDFDKVKIEQLIIELKEQYKVTYNQNATLITIRHYADDTIEELIANHEVLLEQKTRSTARFVINGKYLTSV